jgi:threonine/homoserine/homoserine lactone efflux protein
MSFNELLVYIAFVVGFALTPGPNMMLYLAYTFEYGRKAGWATATGIVSAFIVHITAIVLGLSALLIAMPHALDTLRYCGIAYLVYLAIRNVKMVTWKNEAALINPGSLINFYYRGLIGNLLNPGSILLYFSLIPQFLHPERGHFLALNLILGGLQMLFSFLTNCSIIFFAGYATAGFLKNDKYEFRIRVVMSFLMLVFAVKMLFYR